MAKPLRKRIMDPSTPNPANKTAVTPPGGRLKVVKLNPRKGTPTNPNVGK